jgi:hypothetical protein
MSISIFGRAAAILLWALSAAGSAHAVYRCGNVYQDRPCDDKGPQAHLTPGMKAPAPQGGAASPFAPACARLGQEAQMVMWKREGGATQEAQLAELSGNASRRELAKVIESVYGKRGSAPEVRAAVEAECIAEKQQAADTAAAIRALQAQQAQQAQRSPQQPGIATAPTQTSPPAPATVQQRTAAPTGPDPSCSSWRADLNQVTSESRVGGSAAKMEELQSRRRSIERQMNAGRC